jgi:protein TonB
VDGGILGGLLGGVAAAPNVPPPPPTGPVRVGGNVKPPKIVHIEQPKYPPTAKQAKIEGVVVVEATVNADGSVDKVKVISGPQLLMEAAADAVSHWKYEPTYLNGEAVPVILTARITFSLANSEK